MKLHTKLTCLVKPNNLYRTIVHTLYILASDFSKKMINTYLRLEVVLCENYLYIRNLKYCTFNTIFRQHYIHLEFFTCQHKYKWILSTEKLGLNASFQDFWCTNTNNHLIGFEKTINIYLKAKNFLHTTRISSSKYVFVVFLKKSDASIYI